jgi:hypothetical protein
MVASGLADLPDAVVRLGPSPFHGRHHRLDQPGVLPGQRGVPLDQRGDQADDRAEHIQLHLVGRRVADSHRPAAAIAAELADLRLGAQFLPRDGVERVQAVG